LFVALACPVKAKQGSNDTGPGDFLTTFQPEIALKIAAKRPFGRSSRAAHCRCRVVTGAGIGRLVMLHSTTIRWTRLIVLALGVLLVTSASANSARDAERKAQVMAFTGEPVSSIRYLGMHEWEPLGDHSLLLWENNNRAYFLDLDPTCNDLKWAMKVAVVAHGLTLDSKFDNVLVGERRCQIEEIRLVDVKGLKAAEHAAREARKAGN
jgi:hypothetical protein